MAIDPVRVKLEEAAERADSAASAFYQVLTNDRDTPVPVEGGTVDSMAKRIYDQVGGAIDTLEQAAVDAAEAVVTANTAVATATAKADEASASADAANTAKTDAQTARDLAQAAATAASTSAGTATTKATEAAASATSAATSAGNAATSASAAASSANSAQDSATSASTSAGTATAAASTATTAKNDAVSAKNAAVSAKTAAEAAASAAQDFATSATASASASGNSAATATTKASDAAASATAANAAKTAAELAKSDAQTSAQNAAYSASSVIASRDAAVSAANAAHDSELSAAASALAAQDSADSAASHATDAQASATASSNSAAAAEASKTSAKDSAIEAANSAATATTKAVDAENSAATAAAKAGDAATSANAAHAAQAAAELAKDEAQTSAQNAASYAIAAQSSANSASTSANAAASSAAEVNGLADSLRAEIATKVDKVAGKGLSTNDFTDVDVSTLGSALLSYATYAEAEAAAATLPDGQAVKAPDADGRIAEYGVQDGALVFKDYMPDTIRMQSYAALRNYTGKAGSIQFTTPGISGPVYRDDSDTTSSDNGFDVFVDGAGRRWKRPDTGVALSSWAGDGVDAINTAIALTLNKRLIITPGIYTGDFDIIIAGKNRESTGVPGFLFVDFTGVRFTGKGKLIVDGCKSFEVLGLDAPDFDLCNRGAWYFAFRNCQFKSHIFGDAAGTYFQSNYWGAFYNCQMQRIVNGHYSTYSNKMDWYSCAMRGNAGQGYIEPVDYAFEFNGNTNCQAWTFNGGDVSYHTLDVYNIAPTNVDGDIELLFTGQTYFDTLYPKRVSRYRTRIIVDKAHAANDFPSGTYLAAVSRGSHDAFRQDRAMAWAQHTGINFIPNGDLRVGMSVWTGAGAPIGALAGATVEEVAGGIYGRALRVTQPATTGTLRLRPRALPFRGRYTANLLVKNPNPGEAEIRVAFNNLYDVIKIKDTEPTLWTLTTGQDLEVGTQPDIQILSNNGTPFAVDVLYASVTFGEGGPAFAPAPSPAQIVFSSTSFYNPPSLATGQSATTTLAVSGAAVGDFVQPSFSQALQGLTLTASVSSAGNVDFTFSNFTGSTVDLASGTLRCLITKSSW